LRSRLFTIGRSAALLVLFCGFSIAAVAVSRDARSLELTYDFASVEDSVSALAQFVPAGSITLDAPGLPSGAVELGQSVAAGGLELVPVIVRRAKLAGDQARVKVEYDRPLGTHRELGAMGRFLARRYGLPVDGHVNADLYLIVAPDEFSSNVQALAAWKERMGFRVLVRTTSQIGSTRDQIKAYIQNLYAQADSAPSYVLLVGAVNKIPAFTNTGTPCVTDHPYACVDGNDFLADLFVGRLPAANASELDVMVAKIVGYESAPLLSDTMWYHRALMVGTSYQEGGTPAVTALVTKRLIRERLLSRGFSQIDTVFYPPTSSGRGYVDTAVNRGVLFINGRGWGNYEGWRYPQFLNSDVSSLTNGWKLPVVTSIYCGTGNYQANPCFGEMWLRAGVPTAPRGGVAFWGSSYTGTSTRWNNSMDYGIYQAIFDFGNTTCAPAMYAGKLTQYENFPLPEDSVELRNYFHVYNLMGDPALQMWTAVPRAITVTHYDWAHEGSSSFDVSVHDGQGQPVSGALICLSQSPNIHVTAVTNQWGAAHIVTAPASAGTVLITVTGANLAPYLGQINIGSPDIFIGHHGHSPGTAAPGANVSLGITLRNFGTSQTATGVSATLRASDGSAVVTDSVRGYSDLVPGGTGDGTFSVRVAPSCTSGQRIPLQLQVTAAQGTWWSALELVTSGPTLQYRSYTIADGNGWLDPGETAEMSVVILNHGTASADGLSAVLRSLNPGAISVTDSFGTFGNVAPGESASNTADRFTVYANPGIGVGRRFSLRLVLRGSSGFEFLWDFPVTVGQPTATAPLGPDRHGYYAYDDTDAGYAERPSYGWLEIDPNYGGSGARLSLANDTCVPVALPFNFRFYGRDYGTVSVSDNGFIAPGSQWIGDVYNWSIPSPSGTDGVVAPFWDDFRADTLGASGVYTWFDAASHRFVVEWSRCVHVHGYRPPYYGEQQTFQAIVYDPQYYATRTGDAPIVAQYMTVVNDDTIFENNHNFATIGVESPDNADGLEYTYANSYPAAAAVVADGRAIRFTTNPPDTFVAVSESPTGAEAALLAASPSPARNRVVLTLPERARGTIRIFDVNGRLVRSLPVTQSAGSVVWDARDDDGRLVAPGVYSATLTLPSGLATISCRILVCN
jgi:hypothetical protein